MGDTFGMQPESGASFFQAYSGITLTYLSLPKAQQAIQGQSKGGTGSYRLLRNERACKFMLMRAFCHPGSPLGAERALQGDDNLAVECTR